MDSKVYNIEVLNGQDLTIPIQNVKKQQKIKYFNREEMLDRLYKIPQEKGQNLMMFQFLWRTGCRVTEVINVRKKDLNFADGYITIRWQKNRKYKERLIPMHHSLKNALYMYCSNLKSEDKLFSISRQRADQLAKKYNFEHCHMIRHSFSVNFIKQSKNAWSIRILQRLLGHSKIQTTMSYLDVIPKDQAEELEKIEFD